MYVQTTVALLAQAVSALAVGGVYHGAKIGLFKAGGLPGRTKGVADFDVGDFGGLTNLQAITWGTPFLNSQQQAEVQGALANWLTVSAALLPVTIAGYVIVDTTGAILLAAELFPAPLVFDHSGQNFGGVPRLVFDT